MPQFTVYRNPNRRTRTAIPFLLDVQSDLLEELGTRVVIPLYKEAAVAKGVLEVLMPRFEIDGVPCFGLTPELAGISRKALGAPVADLSQRRYDILAALDLLVTGI